MDKYAAGGLQKTWNGARRIAGWIGDKTGLNLKEINKRKRGLAFINKTRTPVSKEIDDLNAQIKRLMGSAPTKDNKEAISSLLAKRQALIDSLDLKNVDITAASSKLGVDLESNKVVEGLGFKPNYPKKEIKTAQKGVDALKKERIDTVKDLGGIDNSIRKLRRGPSPDVTNKRNQVAQDLLPLRERKNQSVAIKNVLDKKEQEYLRYLADASKKRSRFFWGLGGVTGVTSVEEIIRRSLADNEKAKAAAAEAKAEKEAKPSGNKAVEKRIDRFGDNQFPPPEPDKTKKEAKPADKKEDKSNVWADLAWYGGSPILGGAAGAYLDKEDRLRGGVVGAGTALASAAILRHILNSNNKA